MGSKTLVVVEDCDEVRTVVARILRREGHIVLEASCPLEAIEVIRTYPYPIHLVLSDVVMPQMSGIELARRLRSIEPKVALLFMSGYASEEVVHPEGLGGGFAVLAKPFVAGELVRAVHDAIEPGEASE